MAFRLESSFCPTSLPGWANSFIFIARHMIAHTVKKQRRQQSLPKNGGATIIFIGKPVAVRRTTSSQDSWRRLPALQKYLEVP
jgi:hypothetical protein